LRVKTVYLMPMASGMDQYLANELTRAHVFQVVTDPARADAIFTDHLGAGFEAGLKNMYPEFKANSTSSASMGGKAASKAADAIELNAAEAAAGKDSDKTADQATDVDATKGTPAGSKASLTLKPAGAERAPASSHARGTVFLVGRGTWDVLWSAYAEPVMGRSKQQDQTAAKLVSQLKASMKSASKAPGGK